MRDINGAEAYYRKKAIQGMSIGIAFFTLLVLSFIVAMNTGYTPLSPMDTLRTLFGGGTEKENLILFSFRLPRMVLSILVGAGLAMSGALIQGVTKNALADPGLLGINAGAGLMVVLYVVFFGSKSLGSVMALPFLALIGGGATAILIYVLAFRRHEGVAPLRLVLMGIAVQAGINALMTVLVIKLDDAQFDFVASWQGGTIWGSNWRYVLSLLPWLLILLPYAFYKSRVLDVLSLGTDTAGGLGASVTREQRKLLAVSVALAASCVAVSGSISFVGLIAPHLARRLVGPRHGRLLPVCALVGGVLLSVSDTIARTIVQPSEIPTGIVAAAVGAPYFLYLLAKNKG